MLGGGQTKGIVGLGADEILVAPLARKKPRENGVVGLANDDELIALFLNDHAAALESSETALRFTTR